MLYHICTKQRLSSTDQAYNVLICGLICVQFVLCIHIYVLPKIQLSALTSIIILDCIGAQYQCTHFVLQSKNNGILLNEMPPS